MGITAAEGRERSVTISSDGARLEGTLGLPAEAKAAVLFVHGDSSGRYNPCNAAIVQTLQDAGFATFLLDLLEEREAGNRRKGFDMQLLADRTLAAAAWLREEPETRHLRIGYFGAGTGAAAVIEAAARYPEAVGAVVLCSGRLDLVGQYLPAIQAPTLLIAGGQDVLAAELNKGAVNRLRCPKELVIVRGATHPFEEPGTLEEATRLARDWFQRHLGAPAAGPRAAGRGCAT